MVQGVTGSIDAASASLKESLGDVHQHLLHDFGDTERQMVEQLEVFTVKFSPPLMYCTTLCQLSPRQKNKKKKKFAANTLCDIRLVLSWQRVGFAHQTT